MDQARRSSRHIWILISAGLAGACASSGAPDPILELEPVEVEVSPEVAAVTITADDMLAHITYLASDDLAGRDTPSPGLEKAAAYLSTEFEKAGLRPAGDPESFLQRWEYTKTTLRADDTYLAYGTGSDRTDLEYAVDFFVLPSVQETVTGSAVFLGPIGELLEGTPDGLNGKIVVVTTPPSMGMELLLAVRSAAEAGAAGLIMVLDSMVPAEVIPMVAGQITGSGLPQQKVTAAGITWQAATSMLDSAGLDLEEAAAAGDRVAVSDLTVEIVTPRDRETSTPPNVVGLLRGSDPELADTYVVLSAHFDHVGIGQPDATGDTIYNGADDDASGTAVLLEVADAMAAMPRAPARSVVFLAVSGEEKGLLGSSHYAEHPTVPLSGIVANINLDMIGRNAPDTVIAIGQEYTSLGPQAARIAGSHPDLGLVVAPDPDPSEQAFFRSDHLVFVKQDIPAIFFTTWDHEDYHQPSDEAAGIDSDKAARVARLVFLLAWEVADADEPPTWNEGALEEVRKILATSPF